jgi:hypothetical protein
MEEYIGSPMSWWSGQRLSNELNVPTNNQTKPGGTLKRFGVGDTYDQPDTVSFVREPCRPGFFSFNGTALGGQAGAAQANIATGIENVTKIEITGIKITGITSDPLPDVAALRFVTPGSAGLKHKEFTNVAALPDDCLFVDLSNTGSNYVQFGTPLLLYQSKEGINVNSLAVALLDVNGFPIAYTNIYLWCMVYTMNWQ